MSAFVVSTDTMHRVVRGILESAPMIQPTFAGVDLELPDAGSKIGQKLFEMNSEGVHQRYPDEDDHIILDPYSYDSDVGDAATPEARLKAAECLAYQCYEGNVPETALYQELEGFINFLSQTVSNENAAYQAASWD